MYVAPHFPLHTSPGWAKALQCKANLGTRNKRPRSLSCLQTPPTACIAEIERQINKKASLHHYMGHHGASWGFMGHHGASWGMMQLVQLRGERIYRGASMLGCREIDS